MLTRHGWATLVAAGSAVIVGRMFGLLEMYVLGAGLFAVVLAAALIVNRQLPNLQVRRVAHPDTVAVNEPARVDLHVTNVSGSGPALTAPRRTPRLRLWEPVGEKGGAPMQLAPMRAGETVTAAYRVPSSMRGIVQTGPLRTERSDPLGLCRRVTWLPGTGELLVVPEWVALQFPTLSSSGRLGEHLRMRAMGRTGTEFHSQREYVPGDDLRRINWKSSARTGTLIVREAALEGVHRCTVALDTHRDSYDEESFERAVSAAASVVSAAAASGAKTRLVAPGLDVRGNDVAHESLRWLATVQVGDEIVEHAAAAGTHSDGLGLVVLITGTANSAAHRRARGACGPDESLVIIAVGGSNGSDGRFVVGATSLAQLEDRWNRLIGGHSMVPA